MSTLLTWGLGGDEGPASPQGGPQCDSSATETTTHGSVSPEPSPQETSHNHVSQSPGFCTVPPPDPDTSPPSYALVPLHPCLLGSPCCHPPMRKGLSILLLAPKATRLIPPSRSSKDSMLALGHAALPTPLVLTLLPVEHGSSIAGCFHGNVWVILACTSSIGHPDT